MDQTEALFFMKEAVKLSFQGMRGSHGGPFGAVIVKDGKIIGKGFNKVLSTLDPTAHAEVEAIRDACRHTGSYQLNGAVIFTSCEPCPMCLGAIYWARLDKIYFANSKDEANKIEFDDSMIYEEMGKDHQSRHIPITRLPLEDAWKAFQEWYDKPGRSTY